MRNAPPTLVRLFQSFFNRYDQKFKNCARDQASVQYSPASIRTKILNTIILRITISMARVDTIGTKNCKELLCCEINMDVIEVNEYRCLYCGASIQTNTRKLLCISELNINTGKTTYNDIEVVQQNYELLFSARLRPRMVDPPIKFGRLANEINDVVMMVCCDGKEKDRLRNTVEKQEIGTGHDHKMRLSESRNWKSPD